MQLGRPEWLWLLATLPLAVALLAWGRGRRRRDWQALGQSGRLEPTSAGSWVAAAACWIIALAQPRWGQTTEPPLPPGHDVVLAIDLSRSMAAEDAVPDRLGLAVASAESLLGALGQTRGDRVAVIGFAGRGVLRCPLTEDLGAAVEVLRSLRPGQVRPGGTNLGAALDAALGAFDAQDHAEGRTVIVFSDGEDLADTWRPALGRTRQAGVIVHAVAIGDTEQGHPIPASRLGQAGGPSDPLTYEGKVVLSRRTDAALDAVASATGGTVVRLGLAATDLGRLYASRIEPIARAARLTFRGSERAERFGLFLLAGLGFGLAACHAGGRRRAFGSAWVATLAVLVSATGAGPTPPRLAVLVAQGQEAYRAGRFDDALRAFRAARALDPSHPVPAYNEAATLFQTDRPAEALALYEAARVRAGPALRTKIDFARGNTALRLGDIDGALRSYEECLTSTVPGAALDRVRADAAENKRFVELQAHRAPAPGETDAQDEPRPPEGKPPEAKGEPGRASQPEPPEGGNGPTSDPNPSRRPGRTGGAGGNRPDPSPGSPEDQLRRAAQRVRQARNRRLEETTPSDAATGQKDW